MKDFDISPILIDNELNPNCYHYLQAHNKNLNKGELFEVNIYENLLLWAKNDNRIKWVCSKQRCKQELRDGLGRNSHGQIVYYVDFLSFAEFDMLFMYDDMIINIEATTSTNSRILNNKYFKKLKKNHLMLNQMYNTDKIHTIFILIEQPEEDIVLPENSSYQIVKNYISELDYSKGLPKKIERPIHKMFVKEILPIEYHKEFSFFHKQMIYKFFNESKEIAMSYFKDSLFFERTFIGYIDNSTLDIDLIPEEVRRVYVCLNSNESITLFFIDKNKTYEILNLNGILKLELKRNKFSRSRKMLLYLIRNRLIYKLSKNKILKLFEFSNHEFNDDLFLRKISNA